MQIYENHYTSSHSLFICNSPESTSNDVYELMSILRNKPYYFIHQTVYLSSTTKEILDSVIDGFARLDKDAQILIYVSVEGIEIESKDKDKQLTASLQDLFQITQRSPAKHIAFVIDCTIAQTNTLSLCATEPFTKLYGVPTDNPMLHKSFPILVRNVDATNSIAHEITNQFTKIGAPSKKSFFEMYYGLIQEDVPVIYPSFALAIEGSEQGDFHFFPVDEIIQN